VDLDLLEDLLPLDPTALSTPSTGTEPSTCPPSAPPAPAARDLQCEAVWRHTFLAQFADPHDREALQRFGDLLYTVTLGAGYLGQRGRLFAAEELEAVADDLDALAATVHEISEVPDLCKVSGANLELCGDAKDWEGRLRDLAYEIRSRVREVESGPEPEPVPDREPTPTRDPVPVLDRPLGQDLRDADRIARRLADHHPDPEARRLYRQLVESTGGAKGKSRS
jgi:hypothetical protein